MIVNGPWSTADILSGPGVQALVQPRGRRDPAGPGRPGLADRRQRLRDQPKNSKNVDAAYKFDHVADLRPRQAVFAAKNNLLPTRGSAYKLAAVKKNRLIVGVPAADEGRDGSRRDRRAARSTPTSARTCRRC